jgi:hypothetical protein
MLRTSFARTIAATLALAGVASAPLAAQERGQAVDRSILTVPDEAAEHRGRGTFNGVATIPRGHLPPAGMCRVWIDGVPPGRQARPTDCRTAVRNAPQHARVIDSDGNTYRGGGWYDDRGDRDCRLRDRGGNYEYDRNGHYRYDDDCRRGRDRDRWDDRDGRDDWCRDANHDGRCDARNGGTYDPRDRNRALPEMISTILLESGRRSAEQTRWLGSQRVTARFVDANRNRVPERITWLDSAGRVLQVWVDSSRDGRADLVEVWRDGRRVQVIR